MGAPPPTGAATERDTSGWHAGGGVSDMMTRDMMSPGSAETVTCLDPAVTRLSQSVT